MTIATLRLDESTKLEFGVSITGTNGEPTSRLVIEGSEYSIAFPCTPTASGIETQIKELKNILPAGTYPIRLEIVIENKLYVPFQDTIILEPLVEISTKPRVERKEVKESIRVESIVVNQLPSYSDRLKVAMAIAEMVQYNPSSNESAQEIFSNSISSVDHLDKKTAKILPQLIRMAEDVGLSTK